MSLELIVPSLDAIEEAQRPLYVERDGKFHLDVSGLPDTGKVTRALEAERTRAKQLQDQLKTFNGIDPEEVARLREAAAQRDAEKAERERKDAEARGEYDRILKQKDEEAKRQLDAATAERQRLLAEKDQELTTLRTSMQREKLEADATRAITGARGIPELLLPHVRASTRVVERDGRMAVEVLDAEGNPRTKGASGEPFGLTDLMAEMRASPIYARAFEADGTRGTGSGAGTGGGGTGGQLNAQQVEGLSMAEYRKARAEGRIA